LNGSSGWSSRVGASVEGLCPPVSCELLGPGSPSISFAKLESNIASTASFNQNLITFKSQLHDFKFSIASASLEFPEIALISCKILEIQSRLLFANHSTFPLKRQKLKKLLIDSE
jgi:hypothetical protein